MQATDMRQLDGCRLVLDLSNWRCQPLQARPSRGGVLNRSLEVSVLSQQPCAQFSTHAFYICSDFLMLSLAIRYLR